MCAIMDQVINTNNYKKYILKDNTQHTDLCRHCHKEFETIQHVTGACSQLVLTDYKHRHDQVAKIIHQKLANRHSLLNKIMPYYKYMPDVILENETHQLYWDRALITDKTIHFNRPDITLVDKTKKIIHFIDISIPNNHNLQAKHTEKLTKYSELAFEIKTQWRMDTVLTIPMVLLSMEVIPKTLHRAVSTLSLPPTSYTTTNSYHIEYMPYCIKVF
jgi:hypothetical protein